MPVFAGSLRLAADPESRVRAEIEVDEERLVVRAGGDELGNWSLANVTFNAVAGGFRMNADGEDLILTTGDNRSFADIVGVEPPPKLGANGDESHAIETPPPGADSRRFGQLRKRSAAGWVDDDTLNPMLAYLIMAAALILITGAALSWGDARLVGDDGVPWGRIFVATAAIGAVVGAVIAWTQQRRVLGAGIAVGAGFIALLVLYLDAAEAGLGLGFFLAMVAVVPMTVAAVVGVTSRGIAPNDHEG